MCVKDAPGGERLRAGLDRRLRPERRVHHRRRLDQRRRRLVHGANPTLSGRANFGFNSQYKKNANIPTGETEFNFQVGNFNFHSEAYTWLVVSGCKAQYKGTGTINGVSGYDFTLTAYDGDITAAAGRTSSGS